jgi:hypothetical protein
MRQPPKPGYYPFMGISEDRSWEDALTIMMDKINEAREIYDVEWIGGLQLKMDDNNRSQYIAVQQAILTPKQRPQKEAKNLESYR